MLSILSNLLLKIYPVNDIKKAKLDLLSSTNMTDLAIDIYKELNGDEVPEGNIICYLFFLISIFN